MPTVSFPWLDDGKEIVLDEVPMAGSRELKALARRMAKAEAVRHNVSVVGMMGYVLVAYDEREKNGTEKARLRWNATMESIGRDALVWPEEKFDENLDAWVDEKLLQPLGVKSMAEVRSALKKRSAEVMSEFKDYEESLNNFEEDLRDIELYWRVLASDAESITLPDEKPVRFDRSEKESKEMRRLLSRGAKRGDLIKMREAMMKKSNRSVPLDDEEFSFTDEEVVQGKSRPESGSWTESSNNSTASSEPPTETVEKSLEDTVSNG